MAILSLSNELIINVFLTSPMVYNALRFSGANQLFRDIFIEHETLIIERVLHRQIPAYDDATALAITETRLLDNEMLTNLSPRGRLPLRFCIPGLLRNAELASSACAECAAQFKGSDIRWHTSASHVLPYSPNGTGLRPSSTTGSIARKTSYSANGMDKFPEPACVLPRL